MTRVGILPCLLVLALGGGCTPGPESEAEVATRATFAAPEASHGGTVIALALDGVFLEVVHDAEFGAVAAYPIDVDGDALPVDEPPVLNVTGPDGPVMLVATEESWLGEVDGGWHVADDALLDALPAARFRLRLGGRAYTPSLPTGADAGCCGHDHAADPVAGPHGGHVLMLGPRVHVEVVHNEHWGLVALYGTDAEGAPLAFDEVPALNAMLDEEPVELRASREDWEGAVDGGWHFEHDALLGVPERARFRLVVDGRTYVPPCEHVHVGGAHGHGHGDEYHADCDPALCDEAS